MLNITREQATWILQAYVPIRGHGKITNHKSAIICTLEILRGQPVHMGCNCELPALARITNDMYEQYRVEIEQIANQEVVENVDATGSQKTKGTRKKKTEG